MRGYKVAPNALRAGPNLFFADLTNADFAGADPIGAKLLNANLAGAGISEVNFSKSIMPSENRQEYQIQERKADMARG